MLEYGMITIIMFNIEILTQLLIDFGKIMHLFNFVVHFCQWILLNVKYNSTEKTNVGSQNSI